MHTCVHVFTHVSTHTNNYIYALITLDSLYISYSNKRNAIFADKMGTMQINVQLNKKGRLRLVVQLATKCFLKMLDHARSPSPLIWVHPLLALSYIHQLCHQSFWMTSILHHSLLVVEPRGHQNYVNHGLITTTNTLRSQAVSTIQRCGWRYAWLIHI